MTEAELTDLRSRAAHGDQDAIDELIENATERGDLDELPRLADNGSSDALDQLVELAAERGDLAELRRLADNGNTRLASIHAATRRATTRRYQRSGSKKADCQARNSSWPRSLRAAPEVIVSAAIPKSIAAP
ncbi:hypothetical protein AB0E01_15775 [Nocardia vinacea]|uniref:hypothetical protein n=1 Tax=Nocardia vinacea TaxID=96468 RepID=UPI0033C5BF30